MIKSQSNVVCQGDMCSSECAYIRAKGNNTAYLNFCNDNEPVTFAGPGFTNWSKVQLSNFNIQFQLNLHRSNLI